jgi:glyoxylase-like metal-dependent hydrolase (beta-lactamase superfamily II)
MYNIHTIVVGDLQTNCYVIFSPSGESIIIDPGAEEQKILSYIEKNKLKVKYIINTHAHYDHIEGDFYVKNKTGAEILLHNDDLKMFKVTSNSVPDKFLKDQEIINFDDFSLKILHTPGHSKGGISIVLDKLVFTGDTLFAGGIGRTDLPGGSYDSIINSIKNKLFSLDDDYKIYPGHAGTSTIGHEKRTNPFLT